MKSLGLIFDKNTRKVFLLPEDVKKITSAGVKVFVALSYGATNNINDIDYTNAGAEVIDVKSVVENADIILKVNAFTKNEIKAMNGKTAITLANFIVNVDMLYEMLVNNVKSYEWIGLVTNNSYAFFQHLEEIKGKYAINKTKTLLPKITEEFKNNPKVAKEKERLAKKGIELNIFKGIKNKVLVLNASFASDVIIRQSLMLGWDVTLLDNDAKYCHALLKDQEIQSLISHDGGTLQTMPATFDNLESQFKVNNIFFNTCINPTVKTGLRITKDMIESMPCASLAFDLSCENGFAFMFQKSLLKEDEHIECYSKITNTTFVCPKNITDLFPTEASQIISNNSVDTLIKVAKDETGCVSDILVTKEGKCYSSYINKTLHI